MRTSLFAVAALAGALVLAAVASGARSAPSAPAAIQGCAKGSLNLLNEARGR